MEGFDGISTASGSTLSVDDLADDEVYVSAATADRLDAEKDDTIQAFLGEQPTELTVAGVYESGANPAAETSMVMPLQRLQELTGNEGRINAVIITHEGPAVEGAAGTNRTTDAIEPVLAANNLEADPIKRETLDQADELGTGFASIFLIIAQFSVAAGILLIFLIFVMLAAERKRELGIARGVGMQRGHLVRMFTFEGTLYALVASALGSLLGVGVGWVMVRVLGQAFAQFGDDLAFEIAFAANPVNVVIAFTLGMVLTFLVVLVSAWRVSRMNVVRAIRDIPEPDKKGRTVWGVLLAIITPLIGRGAHLARPRERRDGTLPGRPLAALCRGGALGAHLPGAGPGGVYAGGAGDTRGLALAVGVLYPGVHARGRHRDVLRLRRRHRHRGGVGRDLQRRPAPRRRRRCVRAHQRPAAGAQNSRELPAPEPVSEPA